MRLLCDSRCVATHALFDALQQFCLVARDKLMAAIRSAVKRDTVQHVSDTPFYGTIYYMHRARSHLKVHQGVAANTRFLNCMLTSLTVYGTPITDSAEYKSMIRCD
jgi:hypothetical protein